MGAWPTLQDLDAEIATAQSEVAKTDDQLQKIIRAEFAGATLITIAHRLHTVADFDQIAVMEDGKLREMGKPSDLLSKQDGAFAEMVNALGPDAAATINAKAKASSIQPANRATL